ncbi:hypothetical protein HYY72_03600 [Candidatus Woesearchaeota archaeon]|nr:hypothetical protein [Candidatus Woesearchaeota archaeon]
MVNRIISDVRIILQSTTSLTMNDSNNPELALIKIGGKVIINQLQELGEALSYAQSLGLCSIVVCGAGPQIDEKLKKKNLSSKKVQGLRVTGKKQLRIVIEQLKKSCILLAEEVAKKGGNVTVLYDIFECTKHWKINGKDLGFVGHVKKVNLEAIKTALIDGKLPVICPIGIDKSGQQFNINADVASKELVKALNPKKFILVTEQGGVRDAEGNLIEKLYPESGYPELVKKNALNGGMLLKVKVIIEMLSKMDRAPSVFIVDPSGMLQSLTDQSVCGTIVIKNHTTRRTAFLPASRL